MNHQKDYPLHPGQTSIPPQFVQIPLENYDAISKELEELRKHEVEWDLAKARIKELEAERRWRKFPEEKPEWGIDVLILDKNGDVLTARFSRSFRWISWGKWKTRESNSVTHWMPLPKRPEATK